MCVRPLGLEALGFPAPKRKPKIFHLEMTMDLLLKGILIACLVYPFLDVGCRWLWRRAECELELMGLTMNAEPKCKSLNPISGLCDWGNDCRCWHENLVRREQAHMSGDEHLDMEECYPSNKVVLQFVPMAEAVKTIAEAVQDATFDYSLWDKPNPGLVPEGTQPVEIEPDDGEEEPYPGFSQYGG